MLFSDLPDSIYLTKPNNQWCRRSRDHNLRERDRDQDLVKISRRGWNQDFTKNSETETQDFKFETESKTSKFVHFANFF